MKIERVEVRVVAPSLQRFTWCEALPEQFMTNTVVRVISDQGLEGVGGVTNYTSHDFDRYTAETMRHMIPSLVGRDPLDPEGIWNDLWTRVFPLPPQALAAIDVAIWDLVGKYQEQPLYRLLGGSEARIPSYASTPLLEDVDAYLKLVDELVAQGFKAIKFHCWCVPDKDRQLVRAVREAFPDPDLVFMLDAENNYDLESAIELGKELQDLNFTWFEAPLKDYDIEGYQKLRQAVDVPVIPAGNWIQDQTTFEGALHSGAWTHARTDVTLSGGFTPAMKYIEAVKKARMKCEILSWGNTLVSAANLHLMLASGICSYFEQAVPYEPYEYGMIDTIRTGADGCVGVSEKPGLGFDIDWAAMEQATIHRLETS